jgi:hypothetical protein
MAVQISIAKGTSNPTSSTGLTLGEPAFNYSNNTLWLGKGSGVTPVWVGAGVCGASAGIDAGLTYQIPTLGAVKDYFSAVSSSFLGTTASYVSSFNGLTGAVTGASLGANTFTGLQTLNSGLTTAFAYVSGGATVGGNLYVSGNLTVSGGVTTSVSEIVLIEDNIITLNSNVTGTPTENAGVEIERGTSANTQILWNESTDKWTFTNDGSLYYDIPTDYVGSFNGRTGAVQGVSAAVAGTGIAVSGATGSVTITNIGVQSFNGLTGAVTGVTVGGVNTFTALNTFNAGISSAGGTFSALTRFTAGITASTLYVSGGVTLNSNTTVAGTLYVSDILSDSISPPTTLNISNSPNNVTNIGDVALVGSATFITVDDDAGTITLSAPSGGIIVDGNFNTIQCSTIISATEGFNDSYSHIDTFRTTTTATTANQTIATIPSVVDCSTIPFTMSNPAFEVTIAARDTVLEKTEMLKMLVVQDGVNTVNTQYGLIRTGATGPVSSYSTTLSGTTASERDLLIRATPLSANSTMFTVTVRSHSNL